jgi:hypothetical protein
MLAAESKVHPYRTYEYDWSLELDEAGYHLRYWRVRYSDTKNNSTSHKGLSKTFKRAGLKEGDDDPLWEEDKILTKLLPRLSRSYGSTERLSHMQRSNK